MALHCPLKDEIPDLDFIVYLKTFQIETCIVQKILRGTHTQNNKVLKILTHSKLHIFFMSLNAAEIPVEHVGDNDQDGKADEANHCLPHLNDVGRDNLQYQKQPDIRKQGEEGGGSEHLNTMNPSRVVLRYTGDAYGRNDQKIERCRPNNGAGTEVAGVETIPENLNNREEDLRRARPKRHES